MPKQPLDTPVGESAVITSFVPHVLFSHLNSQLVTKIIKCVCTSASPWTYIDFYFGTTANSPTGVGYFSHPPRQPKQLSIFCADVGSFADVWAIVQAYKSITVEFVRVGDGVQTPALVQTCELFMPPTKSLFKAEAGSHERVLGLHAKAHSASGGTGTGNPGRSRRRAKPAV